MTPSQGDAEDYSSEKAEQTGFLQVRKKPQARGWQQVVKVNPAGMTKSKAFEPRETRF